MAVLELNINIMAKGDFIVLEQCKPEDCHALCARIADNNFAVSLNKAICTKQPDCIEESVQVNQAMQCCPCHAIVVEQPAQPVWVEPPQPVIEPPTEPQPEP